MQSNGQLFKNAYSTYDNINQKEDKIRVNARVPKSLYDWGCSEYDNILQAINQGLEILKESETEECNTDADNVRHDNIQERTRTDDELSREQKPRIEDLKTQL